MNGQQQLDMYEQMMGRPAPQPNPNPMVKSCGITDNEKCKDCKFLLRKEFHNKTYYKCQWCGNSNGSGTDHRISWDACGKFEVDINDPAVVKRRLKTHPQLPENVYPVVSLWQPWATWIMRGWKKIETRTHNRFASLLNKTILIHAGLTTDESALTVNNPYLTVKQIVESPEEVVNGFILGFAYVYDYSKLTAANSQDALIDCESTVRYGLFLKDITPLEHPIRESGEQGIWYYDFENKKKFKK